MATPISERRCLLVLLGRGLDRGRCHSVEQRRDARILEQQRAGRRAQPRGGEYEQQQARQQAVRHDREHSERPPRAERARRARPRQPRARGGRTAIARRALGSARPAGRTEPKAHAIACTMRLAVAALTSSVVLQPKARSENVTSMIGRDERRDVEHDRGRLRPDRAVAICEAPRRRARSVHVEQPRDIGRRVRELRVDAGRPGAGIERGQEILHVAQARHAPRQQQQREREQHELRADEQQQQPHDVHGLRPVVRERRERHRDAGDAARRSHRDRHERAQSARAAPRCRAAALSAARSPPRADARDAARRSAEHAARSRGRAARARRRASACPPRAIAARRSQFRTAWSLAALRDDRGKCDATCVLGRSSMRRGRALAHEGAASAHRAAAYPGGATPYALVGASGVSRSRRGRDAVPATNSAPRDGAALNVHLDVIALINPGVDLVATAFFGQHV